MNWYIFVMNKNDGSKSIAISHGKDGIEAGERIVAMEHSLTMTLQTAKGFSNRLNIPMVNY